MIFYDIILRYATPPQTRLPYIQLVGSAIRGEESSGCAPHLAEKNLENRVLLEGKFSENGMEQVDGLRHRAPVGLAHLRPQLAHQHPTPPSKTAISEGGERWGCTHATHGRIRTIIDPRTPTMPGWARQTLLAPSARRRDVLGESHEG